MNIYQISNSIQEIVDIIESEDNLVSDEAVADTLEALEGELEYKVNDWCRHIKNLTAEADALDIERKRLEARKKSRDNEIERMKSALCIVLKRLGYDKYKTSEYTLYGFRTDKLKWIDKKLVPDELKKERTTKEADEAKIKEILKNGENLPFAKLINSMTVR